VVLLEDDCPDEWDLVAAPPGSTFKPDKRFDRIRVRGPPGMTMAFLLGNERPDEWDVVVVAVPGSLLRRASTFKPGRRFDMIRAPPIMATQLLIFVVP